MIGECGGPSSVWTPHMCLDAFPCVQHPHTFICSPCMSVCSRGYCMHYGGNIPYVGGWGASAHLSGFWYLSVHPLDVHYASSCTFLVVYHVSSLYFLLLLLTTPPVTVVSSGMSSLSLVTMAPSSVGLPTILGQHGVVLLPPMTPRGSGGVLGHASVLQQQPPSSIPLQACANYAMVSQQVSLFFRVEPSATVLYIICLVSVLMSAFYFQVPCWMPCPPLGAEPLGFAPLQPLGVYPWQAYVQSGDGHKPTPGMHRVAALLHYIE